MCLTLAKEVEDQLPEEFVVYKLLRKNWSIWYLYEYKAGWNYPDTQIFLTKGNLEGGGLHVFLDKKDAIHWLEELNDAESDNHRIVEIKVKKENLIAAGYWENSIIPTAAFNKLFLEEDQIIQSS